MPGGGAGGVLGKTLWRHLCADSSRDRTSLTPRLLILALVILPSRDTPCKGSERTTPYGRHPSLRSCEEIKILSKKLLARKDGSLGELWGRTLYRQTRAPNNINIACLIP